MVEGSSEFSVCQFINDGEGGEMSEYVGQRLGAKDAVDLAHSYCSRPAAKLGIIKRVIITDKDDCCCFEWVYGKGVTHK